MSKLKTKNLLSFARLAGEAGDLSFEIVLGIIKLMKKYVPSDIEPKWQKKWREDKLYSPDLDKAKKPFYNLMMFPYPSAEGLHVGNMYPFTGSDIYGRYKRMKGFDTLEPIGLDGFGIHSENYALQVNKHPSDLSKVTEERFYRQLMLIGDAYDWNRTVETYKPDYYKWTQWLFLQMFKKGLAYRKKASVNWCPACKTVLADEQVANGECERCGSKVEQKELEQWFFRITNYAERLLKNLEVIDWSEKVKIAQRNWIGRSEGALINFGRLEVFTTRPDTIFGATFMVISPEHPDLFKFVTSEYQAAVQEYVLATGKKTAEERQISRVKTGEFTGSYVENPVTGAKIPVWTADYVLTGYGTGAIMAVPAHDERDFEFAKKFDLPIKEVISPDGKEHELKEAYIGGGKLINSKEFNGLDWQEAKGRIIDYLTHNHIGSKKVHYHLRDWLISRQRYWGPPIPIIYCDKCGTMPVPGKDLPVELPFVKEFRPTGTGKSPLASVPDFYEVKCPKCSGPGRRETDVSDTFLDSAWYFLRYPSTEFNDVPFDDKRTKKWLPVDMYIGGAEHSVLHLLYSRFVTMVLKDLGHIDFEEPFKTFYAHGLIIKDGAKMSKSKGNVINPDKYIKEYGADTFRTYLMFMGPLSEGGDFRDSGINGIYRFYQRIWNLADKLTGDNGELAPDGLKIMHKTIKKVGEDIESLKYNTAIAALMEWLNYLSRKEKASGEEYKTFLLLLAPFAPHITEELWERIEGKYSIHQQSFPEFDSKYLESEEVQVVVQVNGKLRDTILIGKDIVRSRENVEKLAAEADNAKRFLEGKTVKRIVYVEGRLVNFVI